MYPIGFEPTALQTVVFVLLVVAIFNYRKIFNFLKRMKATLL